jgi:osmotically-inducible protein OsmY
VTRVRNNLKVDRREGPDDALIESQIQQALRRDPYVAHYDLGVEVQGGTAILTGTADSYFEKAQADVDASQVYGVLDVANDITVNRKQPLPYQSHVDEWYVYDFDWYNHAPGHTFRPDFEIQEDIVNQLWWSPFVDAADVTVEVDDGVATLTGTVDSWSEYWAARENALEGGAVWVDNELHVAASG